MRGRAIALAAAAAALFGICAMWVAPARPGATATADRGGLPTGCRSSGTRLITHGPRNQRVIALTFDDGPSQYTRPILRTLKAAGVKATFFPVARDIRGREDVLRATFRMGMEIENHSFTHADLGNGGPIATTEMRNATNRIRAVIGFTPCIFRPPFAVQNDDLIRRARSLGMSTVGRDVDPFDWQEPGTDAIVSRVLDRTRPGSIINLHDGGGTRSQTVAALPRIIKGLRDRGYRMTTVSKLLGYRPTFSR